MLTIATMAAVFAALYHVVWMIVAFEQQNVGLMLLHGFIVIGIACFFRSCL